MNENIYVSKVSHNARENKFIFFPNFFLDVNTLFFTFVKLFLICKTKSKAKGKQDKKSIKLDTLKLLFLVIS
jgi:hypothetical protein